MNTTTETQTAPEGVKSAEARGLVLFAVIKASSKYAYQGREGGRVKWTPSVGQVERWL